MYLPRFTPIEVDLPLHGWSFEDIHIAEMEELTMQDTDQLKLNKIENLFNYSKHFYILFLTIEYL